MLLPRAPFGDAAAVDGQRVRRIDDRAAHLDGQRRGAGQRVRRRAATRCASTSTRASWRRTASASTRWRPRSRTTTSTCRPARFTAPDKTLRRAGQRPADARRRAYGPTIIAYRNGNPVRLDEVAHVYDGIENDKSVAWYRRPAHDLPRHPETAGHQRRRRSCDAVKQLLPDLPRAAAGVGVARRPHRPLGRRSASRCTT